MHNERLVDFTDAAAAAESRFARGRAASITNERYSRQIFACVQAMRHLNSPHTSALPLAPRQPVPG